MENKEQIIEECKKRFTNGQTRDDIDAFLKDMKLSPKKIAAIDYQLQDMYIEYEENKLLINEAQSNIVAGYLIFVVCTIFGAYTIHTKGYWSLIICLFLFMTSIIFISKGREQQKSIKTK